MTVDADILAMAQALGQQFPVEQVILFGSRARGHATADSDVDLLVIVPPDVPSPRELYLPMRKALSARWPVPLDLVIRSRDAVRRWQSVPYSLIHEAMTEGTVLYERPR